MTTVPLRLKFVAVKEWPVLAWLARCEAGTATVTVYHGERVETAGDWFCEATWDGAYDDGDFDRTDIVAGSGGRIRNGELVFVPTGATIDRLQSFETPRGAWVSNSLACLLAAIDARVHEASGPYFWLFRTIVRGLARYRRKLPTSLGDVQLTYFDNLVWDGRSLSVRPKPGGAEDFSTFDRYTGFLESRMHAIAENAASRARRYPYAIMSTASSGYDSSAITVLARNAGATEVLCFDQARRGIDDSGEPLARQLGMRAVVVPRGAWSERTLPEPPFLAADAHGGDVFFKGAEEVLRGKVLLTGYHGDKMWAKDFHASDDVIVRGDQSGLSLAEYRLTVGMLHCPVAFWGARQIADLHRISNAPEMAAWDVPGDYSRPICRRIVETAGVPRELFGRQKKATWVTLPRSKRFLSAGSMPDYFRWLDENRWKLLKRGRMPPVRNFALDDAERRVRATLGHIGALSTTTWYLRPVHSTGASRVLGRLGEGPTYLRRFVFAWAVDHHTKAFPRVT